MTLWGLGALALSMTSAMLLVTDVLFARMVAIAVAVSTGALICCVWWALPVGRRRRFAASAPDPPKRPM